MWWSLAEVDWTRVGDKTLVGMDASQWEYHRSHGLAAVPYTSQANGYFQRLAQGTVNKMSAMHQAIYDSESNRKRFERLTSLAAETGWSLSQLILGSLMSQPFPPLPVIGPQSLTQLEDSLAAADVHLTPEQLSFLNPL
jgi:aryl-alcohol dehydrogenase-like predicted oxidoreductase